MGGGAGIDIAPWRPNYTRWRGGSFCPPSPPAPHSPRRASISSLRFPSDGALGSEFLRPLYEILRPWPDFLRLRSGFLRPIS